MPDPWAALLGCVLAGVLAGAVFGLGIRGMLGAMDRAEAARGVVARLGYLLASVGALLLAVFGASAVVMLALGALPWP
jgi:hypothetical protein